EVARPDHGGVIALAVADLLDGDVRLERRLLRSGRQLADQFAVGLVDSAPRHAVQRGRGQDVRREVFREYRRVDARRPGHLHRFSFVLPKVSNGYWEGYSEDVQLSRI